MRTKIRAMLHRPVPYFYFRAPWLPVTVPLFQVVGTVTASHSALFQVVTPLFLVTSPQSSPDVTRSPSKTKKPRPSLVLLLCSYNSYYRLRVTKNKSFSFSIERSQWISESVSHWCDTFLDKQKYKSFNPFTNSGNYFSHPSFLESQLLGARFKKYLSTQAFCKEPWTHHRDSKQTRGTANRREAPPKCRRNHSDRKRLWSSALHLHLPHLLGYWTNQHRGVCCCSEQRMSAELYNVCFQSHSPSCLKQRIVLSQSLVDIDHLLLPSCCSKWLTSHWIGLPWSRLLSKNQTLVCWRGC